jgi:hypothetical protein
MTLRFPLTHLNQRAQLRDEIMPALYMCEIRVLKLINSHHLLESSKDSKLGFQVISSKRFKL